ARRSPPNRFSTPVGSPDGPNSSSSIVAVGASAGAYTPRGSFGWLADECHQAPFAGAPSQRASGSPSIPASAPQPRAFAAPAAGGVPPAANRGTSRPPDAQHPVGGGVPVGTPPDDHAGGAGAHEMKRRLVVGAAAHDHRQVQ